MTAAGSGTRLGHRLPKALVPLAGRPILSHALDGVAAARVADAVIVTAPPDLLDDVRSLAPGAVCVAGGESRQASVANALSALPADVEVVLVHDAARPLTPPEVFHRVVDAVRSGHGAVVPAMPVVDTIKSSAPVMEVSREGGSDAERAARRAAAARRVGAIPLERVTGTVDRTTLRAVQTPQGFDRDLLVRAHTVPGGDISDDAGLVEALGEDVWLVAGSERSLKITTPWDLELAEFLLARSL
ncbi:MAG TPA: 2-C-methyl-D-erythritol 4-phosphate cytidylyltransferase [Actinomycetaceae bacterium]|nr:2-C-methyl-D-erythritol 4-phosphate cytidylyltransferase [Actinomycetaceae bacterium]